MKPIKILAVSFVVLALGTSSLRAEIITIGITAEIAEVDDLGGLLNGQLGAGNIITGRYTYDSAAQDSQPLTPNIGDYWHYSSPYGIRLFGSGFIFQTDPGDVEFLVEIVNGEGRDSYLLRSYNNLPLYEGVCVQHIAWELDDFTGIALSSDALSLEPPVLKDWDSICGIDITGNDRPPDGCGGNSFSIRAHVTSVELVPEPASFLLFTLAGLFLRKR
jgi:hypothetical protein